MEHRQTTSRQSFFLLFLFLLGNLITAGGAKAIPGGWILLLSLCPISMILFSLFLKVTEGRPVHRIFTQTLGSFLGGFFTVIYCVLAILMAGDSIRLFADFIVINDLNNAGAFGNTALMTILVLLMLYLPLYAQGRAAWLFCPLTIIMLLTSIFLTIREMDLDRLLPISELSSDIAFPGIISSLAGILAPAFFPIAVIGQAVSTQNKTQVYAAGIGACFLLALLSFRDLSVLGSAVIGLFRFPGFTAASIVRHSEVLISAAFVFAQPFRTALCLRYVYDCLQGSFPRWKAFYPPILLTLSVISGMLSWSSEQVKWRTAGESVVLFLLFAGPLLTLLARRKKPPIPAHKSSLDA